MLSAQKRRAALSALTVHHCVLATKAEVDQFCDGLQTLGVLQCIRENPELFREFFVANKDQRLTSGWFLSNNRLILARVNHLIKFAEFVLL